MATTTDYYSGAPNRPNYSPVINNNPATGDGTLQKQFQLNPQQTQNQPSNLSALQSQLGGINLNTQGLDALRQKATQTGPSAWANLATQQEQQGEQTQRNQAVQGAAGNAAAARSGLAMQGGLTSGARERMATSGTNAANAAQQNIGAAGAAARTGISTQDEQNKNSLLTQLPGAEVQALQPQLQKTSMWEGLAQQEGAQNQQNQQFNAANNLNAQQYNSSQAIGENRNVQQQGIDAYNNQMKNWAANQQANATANSGKK